MTSEAMELLREERNRVIEFLEKIAGMAARFQTIGRSGSPHLYRMSVLELTIREFISDIQDRALAAQEQEAAPQPLTANTTSAPAAAEAEGVGQGEVASAAPDSGEGIPLEWQEGIAGACNIATYDGSDVVGVAFVPKKRHRENLVNKFNALRAYALSLREKRERMVEVPRETVETCKNVLELYGGEDNLILASDLGAVLAAAPSAGGKGWIAVSEKLPVESTLEQRHYVLAWFNWGADRNWYQAHQFAEIVSGHWRPSGGNGNFDKYVTHWMSLPPAPPASPAGRKP